MRLLVVVPLLLSLALAQDFTISLNKKPKASKAFVQHLRDEVIASAKNKASDPEVPIKPPADLFPARSAKFSSRATTDCGCGRTTLNRIVGGNVATPHSLPYQAFVQPCFSNGRCYLCGGTLLNKRYVLTAMHCLVDQQGNRASSVTVGLGEHDIRSTSEAISPQSFSASVIGRDDYNANSFDNDIAILKLNRDATFNDNVIPACLPTNINELYVGQSAKVSGWGTTSSGGSTSNVLKETDVTITAQSDATCTKYASSGVLPNIKMCAYKDNTDSCQGDSGGPLAVKENGKHTVVGVVSYGRGCATPGYAGVYARVTSYNSWIRSNIADGWCGDNSGTTQAPSTQAPSTQAPSTQAPSTQAPSTQAPTTQAPSGNGCDLSCFLGNFNGFFSFLGHEVTCANGICSANSFDLCGQLDYPCGGRPTAPPQQGLTCNSPCNFRRALRRYMRRYRRGKLDRFTNFTFSRNGEDIPVTCDLKTGQCCADPSHTGSPLC